jgi:hypothetical protein
LLQELGRFYERTGRPRDAARAIAPVGELTHNGKAAK